MTIRAIFILIVAMVLFMAGCSNQSAVGKDAEAVTPEASKGDAAMVFQPVVAGQFYTGDPKSLAKQVDSYIENAKPPALDREVLGIVSPHAGYIYSGRAAGYAYKAVKDKTYDTVVVIGLSHRAPGQVAVLNYERYKTPLGEIPIDLMHTKMLIDAAPWINDDERMFSQEHSLEVQLPFLQRAVKEPAVVMISMRSQNLDRCRELAEILDKTFKDRNVLFVASSDMSHFHDYEFASKMDKATLDLVDNMEIEKLASEFDSGKSEMCGSGPVLTLMELYKLRGGDAEGIKILKYENSGDTAGDKNRVVGYGSVAFTLKTGANKHGKGGFSKSSAEDYLSADEKKKLLQIARKTVQEYVTTGKKPNFDVNEQNLAKPGAAFVTLHKNGQLRGCIGHIIAKLPLWKCVRDMAIAAATQDPRFSKVSENEIPQLHIEVSVLTPPKPLDDPQKVEVGKHGLIMSRGFNRGLLLPQVPTEWGWDRDKFLMQTCRKAGMKDECWKDPETKIETFEAIVFSE